MGTKKKKLSVVVLSGDPRDGSVCLPSRLWCPGFAVVATAKVGAEDRRGGRTTGGAEGGGGKEEVSVWPDCAHADVHDCHHPSLL